MKIAKLFTFLCISFLFLFIFIACPPLGGTEGKPTPAATSVPTPKASPPPGAPHPPEGIEFIYKDRNICNCLGNIIIDRADDETDVARYNLYWGVNATTKFLTTPFASITPPAGSSDIDYQINLSEEANFSSVEFILAYAENSEGVETAIPVPVTYVPTIRLNVITDLNPNSGDSNPAGMCIYNDKLYFSASDSIVGRELASYYAEDNISILPAAGDLITGAQVNEIDDGNPKGLAVFNNKLYFAARDPVYGIELHSMDVDENITRITDINPDGADSFPRHLTPHEPADTPGNEVLYFTAEGSGGITELYSCSLTDVIVNINSLYPSAPDPQYHTPESLGMAGSTLYFTATDESDSKVKIFKLPENDPVNPISFINTGAIDK